MVMRSPHEVMGHGRHVGMSMDAAAVNDMRNRFLVAAVLSVPILLWSPIGRQVLHFGVPAPFGLRDDVFQLILSLPVIAYSGAFFFEGAVGALRARTLDMMVLVSTAIVAGWTYSVVITLRGGGDVFYEATTVLIAFVLLGHWLEARARGGANDAVRALLNLSPPQAIVIRDGAQIEVPTSEVQVEDLLLIKPGAKIPVDAVVEEGTSEVDESVVTGESLPVPKTPGAELIGGSINKNGTLRARATKVGSDTALAQIVKLVQEAQSSKAPGQRLADRAAFWLVLVALIGGTLTLVVWLLAGRSFSQAILFAITVVVITCPDALGLATPTAIMVGTGLGAKRGILFKNKASPRSRRCTRTACPRKKSWRWQPLSSGTPSTLWPRRSFAARSRRMQPGCPRLNLRTFPVMARWPRSTAIAWQWETRGCWHARTSASTDWQPSGTGWLPTGGPLSSLRWTGARRR